MTYHSSFQGSIITEKYQKLCGYISEVEVFGTTMLSISVDGKNYFFAGRYILAIVPEIEENEEEISMSRINPFERLTKEQIEKLGINYETKDISNLSAK